MSQQMAGPAEKKRKRILAVASGGGHWIQLMRMMPAFEGCDIAFVTTMASYRAQAEKVHQAAGSNSHPARFYVVNDANRWNKFGLIRLAASIFRIVSKERPTIVISTGAAPGYFAIRAGKLFGARTIWVDSVANVEELSLSGRKAGKHANLWLTQWPHLARPEGPQFKGAVL